MSVDDRLDADAEILARELASFDISGALRQLFALVRDETEGSSEALAGRGVAAGSAQPRHGEAQPGHGGQGWVERELALYYQCARGGNAAATRRVAELLDLLDREEEAVAWWHRATAAGDPDAVDYVREFLSSRTRR